MSSQASRLGTEFLVVVAATLALVLLLAWLYRPEYLNTDTAQYVVTARHLVRGEGLSTSLLYFEDQLRLGRMPSPQTTWPPGFPVLIAAAMAAGLPDLYAPFVIALLADALLPLVVFFILRTARCTPAVCAAGALLTLAMAFPHVLVLRGLTESTFTLVTALGLWAVARAAAHPQREFQPLLWAGVAAGCAFMTRYAGIAYIGALGGFLLLRWLRMRSAQRFWRYAVVGAIPVLAVGALFLRNWSLVRNAYGGPDIAHGSNWLHVTQRLAWAFQDLLGLESAAWSRGLLLVMLAACGYVAARCWAARGHTAAQDPGAGQALSAVLSFSGWYAAATIIMLAYLGQRRFAELISARYLAPLLPFIVCAACAAFEKLRTRYGAGAVYRQVTSFGLGLVIALTAVQWSLITRAVGWFAGDEKYETLQAAFEQPLQQGTVRDFLLQQTARGEALLDVDGQLLGMLLDRPTVGLSEAAWTWRTWTEAEVLKLVANYDVAVICFFPTLFRADDPLHRHRVFYRQLAAGQVPDWLKLAVDTPLLRLYTVTRLAGGAEPVSKRTDGGVW